MHRKDHPAVAGHSIERQDRAVPISEADVYAATERIDARLMSEGVALHRSAGEDRHD